MSKNKVLIILGCSRSGTSFTANWLHEMGLNLGENMVGVSEINKKGHFEDVELLAFHNQILKDNHTDFLAGLGKEIIVSRARMQQAKELYDARQLKSTQWGWKEPRTCLFLDMWQQIIPNAYYLIIFRDYKEVVDSLMKMEIKSNKNRKNRLYSYYQNIMLTNNQPYKNKRANIFLESWIRNNKDILNFFEKTKKKEQFIFCSIDSLKEKSTSIYTRISSKWGFDLTFKDANTIFDKQLLTTTPDTYAFDSDLETTARLVITQFNDYIF